MEIKWPEDFLNIYKSYNYNIVTFKSECCSRICEIYKADKLVSNECVK